jgi:hypothetical protein
MELTNQKYEKQYERASRMIKKLTREDLSYSTFSRSYYLPFIALSDGKMTISMDAGVYKIGDEVDLSKETKGFIDFCIANNKPFDTILVGKSANLFRWEKAFNNLGETDQWKIKTVVSEIFNKPELKAANDVTKCLAVANTRIKKVFGETCGRCGGSGHYAYNQIDGTKCYGCNGTKKKLPRLTKKKKAEIEAYFKAEQEAKKTG